VHDDGIEAPHRWGNETPVGLVDRLQNWIAYAEGMAREEGGARLDADLVVPDRDEPMPQRPSFSEPTPG
jgi:hypothetical protein